MAKGKSIFESKGFKVIMSRIYGLGAAVVIIGALFKILHWEGANQMLMIGLLTEAAIFAISAFEPVKSEVDWTLVYPELAGMEAPKKGEAPKPVTFEKMLQQAQIDQGTVNKLGESFRGLTENVGKMSGVANAANATNEYATQITQAAQAVGQLNASYGNAITAIERLGNTGDVSEQYYKTVQQVTQKMSSLNSIYELELTESQNHIRQLNNFIGGLSKTVENLADTEDSTNRLKDEFRNLGSNLSTLNTVYGNMLSAMSAPGPRN